MSKKRLVPTGRVAEKDFFNPMLSSIEQKKWKYYQEEVKKLERTLVFRSPISPMGHLKFCLEYAIKSKEVLDACRVSTSNVLERDAVPSLRDTLSDSGHRHIRIR